MKDFEHKVADIDVSFMNAGEAKVELQNQLDYLSRKGWELVTVIILEDGDYRLFLKKRLSAVLTRPARAVL